MSLIVVHLDVFSFKQLLLMEQGRGEGRRE